MTDSNQPRRPTAAERQALIDLIETERHYEILDNADVEDLSVGEYVAAASIAVFDHFVSTQANYTGKVMVVVWNVGPECYEVYGWVNGRIERMSQNSLFAD